MNFKLPPFVKGDAVVRVLSLLGKLGEEKHADLDFSELRRITPAGLAGIAAIVSRWRSEGWTVNFAGLPQCQILGNLQRMNFLQTCGIDSIEASRRKSSIGRFVPLVEVAHPIEKLGTAMATCLAPGGEDVEHPLAALYDLANYVVTETANNVLQHSAGRGFATAQVGTTEGMVRLAVADNGQGILQTFKDAGSLWAKSATHGEAISKALQARVSCKCGPPNEGVGLTLVSALLHLTGGWLVIASGDGVLAVRRGDDPIVSRMPEGGFYRGTLVAMSFRQLRSEDFPSLLETAKAASGLLRQARSSGRFAP